MAPCASTIEPETTLRLEALDLARTVEGRVLFSGLCLAVAAGETVVVRGPSGTGKTLLLRALAWLDPLEGGTLRLDGRTPTEWGIPEWRARVSYVSQFPATFPGTPRALLDQVVALTHQRGRVSDDPVALAARWALPEATWDRAWAKLSGGERQRISLAVALSRRPDVLLLDEPTSAVDTEATLAIEAALRGRTALWVTHDDAQAERLGGRSLEIGP